jgi:predicted deacylase
LTENNVQHAMVAGPGASVPVVVISSREPGATVAIGANLHGDECTGVGVVHALIRELPAALRAGSVVLYPSLNPKGLEEGVRHLPGDTLDPNRAFPGTLRGTAAQRHAARIWADLLGRRPELYIDLHTDAGGAVPYAIVDRVIDAGGGPGLVEALRSVRRSPGGAGVGARAERLAAATGLTVLREYPLDRYRRFELDRSLPGALVNSAGVAAFPVEVGPRRWFDPGAVAMGCRAVRGVLGALKMVEAPILIDSTRRNDRVWRRESGPRTSRGGLLVPLLPPGASFVRGQALVEVRGLAGELREVLRAPSEGWLVALPEVAQIAVGVACATLAVPEEPGDDGA